MQFGEGGAGTFSDGKLNTLVKDKEGRSGEVLRIFVEHGAPSGILYENKPHIGTDILSQVVRNMREQILSWGGDVHFNTKVTELLLDKGRGHRRKMCRRTGFPGGAGSAGHRPQRQGYL